MTRTLGYFLAGSIAGLVILAGAFYLRAGVYGSICVAIAGVICITPTLISLALSLWSKNRARSEQIMAAAGGMLFRMGGVLIVSLPVFLSFSYFREGEDHDKSLQRELTYWSAILICYLGTLALETVLAARAKPEIVGASPGSAASAAGGAK